MPHELCKIEQKDFQCRYAETKIIPKVDLLQYQQDNFKESLKELKEIVKEETKKCLDASMALHKRLEDIVLEGGHAKDSGVPWKVIIAVAIAIGGTEGGKAILLKFLGQ